MPDTTNPTMPEDELRAISARPDLPPIAHRLLMALRRERARADEAESEVKRLENARAFGLRMMKERDERLAAQKCLSVLRPHDSPDGPPCQMMGEFKCFDCGAWVCRNHAEFHFKGSERSRFKERAEAAETALAPFAAVAEMLDSAAWPTPDPRWQHIAEWSRRAKALLSPPAVPR